MSPDQPPRRSEPAVLVALVVALVLVVVVLVVGGVALLAR
jgi:hypothetical protein